MSPKDARSASGKFVFRRNVTIGAADALEDEDFLRETFVDTGDLDVLKSITGHKSVILGRTGAGKTALLRHLRQTQDHVIELSPEDLALTYLSDNGVLRFFAAAGVNLHLFYQLLWRHVIAVEIVRERFHVVDETSRDGFFRRLSRHLGGNRQKEAAIEYLREWGSSFWLGSKERVEEVTRTFETNLTRSATAVGGIDLKGLSARGELNAGTARRLSEEQRASVQNYGQEVVDRVQMEKLSKVMEILDQELLEDKQNPIFITVDRLDKSWAPDDLRYRLIRALLDASRDFNNRVSNVKVLLALRDDLFGRVFRYTRDAGFQEEKYTSLVLKLTWDPAQLRELIDRRVRHLVKQKYTTQEVTLDDVLPAQIERQDPVKYMVDRTMYRPRDMIAFFNECIEVSSGRPKITADNLRKAEASYSRTRLRAIADEWLADFPHVIELVQCLKGYPQHFRIADVREDLLERVFDVVVSPQSPEIVDPELEDIARKLADSDELTVLDAYFKVLFRVGAVGIKFEPYMSVSWSFKGHEFMGISDQAVFHVHPMLHSVLGTRPA